MKSYKTVFTTERGQWHQQDALAAAPDFLDITMLRLPDRAILIEHLRDAEFFISERVGVIDGELIRAAPNLRLIQRIGSLTDDIDVDAAQAAGIPVAYMPILSVIRVAEHLVMQMLALSKKLREVEPITLAASPDWRASRRTDEDTFAYNWSGRGAIGGLWEKSIGVMGFGEIGAELARRLKGWGCAVSYRKRRRLSDRLEAELGLTYVETDDALYGQSDILVNLLPYFPNTNLLLNANVFAKMKPGSFIVSVGSGSVIDESALADAIRSGHLGGAALDTYEWEPIKAGNPLIELAQTGHNVLLTPHVAAGTTVAGEGKRAGDYRNIVNLVNGKPLVYVVS